MWFNSERKVTQDLGAEAVAQSYVFKSDQARLRMKHDAARECREPSWRSLITRPGDASLDRNSAPQQEINKILSKQGNLTRAWLMKRYQPDHSDE